MSQLVFQGDYRETEIGFLPENWEIKKLGDIDTEKPVNITPRENETYEYYSIPAYQKLRKPVVTKGKAILSQKKVLKEGMILFGKLNPRVEKVWQVKPYTHYAKIGSGEWLSILPNPREVEPDYLYFLELSDYVMPIAKKFVTGSTPSRQRVDPRSFYGIRIPIPPLQEQKKIAYVLSTIQKAQEKTENFTTSLRELKKSLMKHLFTHGAISLGDAEKVILKETEIGMIPGKWDVAKLGDVASITYGIQAAVAHLNDSSQGIPILTNINIRNDGFLNLSVLRYYNLPSNRRDKLLLKGDILFNWRSGSKSHVGKTAIFGLDGEYTFSSFILRFRTNEKISNLYLFYYLMFLKYLNFFSEKGNVSSVNAVFNASYSADIPIYLPPLLEQEEIASILSSVSEKIVTEERRKASLDKLFKSMLYNLVTARIRVDNSVS